MSVATAKTDLRTASAADAAASDDTTKLALFLAAFDLAVAYATAYPDRLLDSSVALAYLASLRNSVAVAS